ncbi:hypothetical protein MTP99_003972 [Tenebrio molitor]|jgi:Leucine-rich repeat (LRR) protein|nr:hypothetical protein MTP99_003972 [Tenebrio molitor]
MLLDLSHNNITSLNPAVFQFLNLSHNSIKEFQYGTFNHLKRLETLDISNNQLTDLHQYTFNYLLQLSHLKFDNNQITSFDGDNLGDYHYNLQNISLNGNPWKCEDLAKINDVLKFHVVRITEGSTFDKENYRGIPCTNEKHHTQNLTALNKTVIIPIDNFSKSINQIVQNSGLSRYLVVVVLLQIVICCLLVFIAYLIFNFVQKNSPKYGTRRSSQVEIMLQDSLK